MRYVTAMILAAGLAATAAPPGFAQDGGTPQPAPDDCMVAPQQPAPGTDALQDDTSERDTTLSDVLDPCNGVLQPPPVGDRDLTVTPPDVGRTPVIEPQDVPVQPAEPE